MIALFLLLFSYLAYTNIVYGLSIIIILLPSYLLRFSIFGLPSSLLELMIIILFFIFLIKDKKYKSINYKLKNNSFNKLPKPYRYILLLWILVSIFGLIINFSFGSLGIWRAYFLEPLMFFIVFIYSINNSKDKEKILKSFIILISYLFIIAIYQYFTNWNLSSSYFYPNIHRLTSVFPQPNMLSLLLAPISSFLFVYSLEFKKKIWYIIPAILGFSLLYLAKSHGALIAVFIALLFYFLIKKSYRKISLGLIILGIVFISLFSSPLKYLNNFKEQLFNPGTDLQITSLEVRSHLWRDSFNLIKDNYLLGTGIRSFKEVMKNYHTINWIEIYPHSHNIFLHTWIELGLFGVIVFILFLTQIFISLKELYKKKKRIFFPLALSWITFIIHGLVDLPYFKNDLAILFFILLGFTILSLSNED